MNGDAVAIYGAGGHAKVIIDILERQAQYRLHCLLDDDRALQGSALLGHLVRGGRERLSELFNDERVEKAIVAVGANAMRLKIGALLETAGFELVTAIHPSAVIPRDVAIGRGTVVMAGALVNPDAAIGTYGIINTGAIVEHDCRLGDGVHVAPGAVLCGGVSVGSGTLIGVGARVLPGITVGREVVVGAGATVLHDVPDYDVVVGTPARSIREKTNAE